MRKPRLISPDPRPSWQIEQGAKCGCRGTDDMCPCQNDRRDEARATLKRAMAYSVLLQAAKALVDRDCRYDGPNLVVPAANHIEAMRLAGDLRSAIAQAEAS